MPPTEQFWAEKDQKKSKEIAYFNSVNASVQILVNDPEYLKAKWEEKKKAFQVTRDFLYKEWESWYADNIVEPQGADGEEPTIQTKIE